MLDMDVSLCVLKYIHARTHRTQRDFFCFGMYRREYRLFLFSLTFESTYELIFVVNLTSSDTTARFCFILYSQLYF